MNPKLNDAEHRAIKSIMALDDLERSDAPNK